MNATKTVGKRKLGYNQYVKPEKFRLLLAIIVSKNWISVFVYVANRLCLCDLKLKQTFIQVNRRTTRNGVIQAKRLHWNSAERKVGIISIPSKSLGLNPITREQSVSTLGILKYSFCEECKHLSRRMKFIRSTFFS